MLQYAVPLVAIAIVVLVSRAVAERSRRNPGRRVQFRMAGVAALALAAALIPWVLANLDPPWSESPAGIFLILGKVVVAGSFALTGLGAVIGSYLQGAPDGSR
jgi:ABC-type transport system involved in cytochrome c biogenesis permease subunit